MPVWREKYVGVEEMSLAVMGCIVKGPGESKHADIGISLPGTGEEPAAPVFIDGKKHVTLRGKGIAEDLQKIVDQYVETRYEKRACASSPAIGTHPPAKTVRFGNLIRSRRVARMSFQTEENTRPSPTFPL